MTNFNSVKKFMEVFGQEVKTKSAFSFRQNSSTQIRSY